MKSIRFNIVIGGADGFFLYSLYYRYTQFYTIILVLTFKKICPLRQLRQGLI